MVLNALQPDSSFSSPPTTFASATSSSASSASKAMSAVFRQPLAPRAVPQLPMTIVPSVSTKSSFLKRPRSPELYNASAIHELATAKRHKALSVTARENADRERRRAEREILKEEFRSKYTKAFPSWTFYFDVTDAERVALVPRILQLNGHIAKFFSNEVTHFITNRPVPGADVEGNKENSVKPKAGGSALRSPIKLKGLPDEITTSGYETLVRKAKQFGMKIWDTSKLDSVLQRCSVPAHAPGILVQPHRSLTSLLESEKRYGTTSERDPTQKRHDYHYFSKGSYFVLVEDMRQEFATIAALEYPVTRTSDGMEKGTWPVPYCHPLSRGPFVEYNEKEERHRGKQERLDKEREQQRVAEADRLKMRQLQRKRNDLRRSVSMINLQRQACKDGPTHRESYEVYHPTNAHSGNGASGFDSTATGGSYVAASGNSVSIASTYGTTSTIGGGSSRLNGLCASALPISLRGRLQNQVVTSRRVNDKGSGQSASMSKASASSAMMPPPEVPERCRNLLRKCKSTNTLRPSKRDEKSKPGYCESCRQKFENFKIHIRSRRHQKFANSDANFVQLDYALNRVRRPTFTEIERTERQYIERVAARSSLAEGEFLETAATNEAMLARSGCGDNDNKENDHPTPIDVDEDAHYIYLDDNDDENTQMDAEP
ncbi:hypothetical protein EW145_g2176 [Phellinidium pouzarii]|uniref:DBF4-type domain-containing protein n=1 Tax=Phellinidium pouzarii TaxID=167371 RepID=A0A4S4LDR7_9AGAM|nr:hypothetical protein EW145_g2176 [Phellinidium pouzarii]